MAKNKHNEAVGKASGKGKLVLRNGELVPIESLIDEPLRETPEQAAERKEAVEAREAEKAEEESKPEPAVELTKSKREVNESRRLKGLRALIKNKVHYDPNWLISEVMEACEAAGLLDEKGKLIKDESTDEEVISMTPKEAKYRSDLQAQMMDEDIEFDMSADTEELEEIWETWVDAQEETPREEYLRILIACGYDDVTLETTEDDFPTAELKKELETFRAEMVEVAKGMGVAFKGKAIDILHADILKAKDEQEDENDEDDEESNGGDDSPEPTAPKLSAAPKPEVKEKDLSPKDKILLDARKDDLIAKIKGLGNADLKPTKAYGLPKLEAMWKENRPKL